MSCFDLHGFNAQGAKKTWLPPGLLSCLSMNNKCPIDMEFIQMKKETGKKSPKKDAIHVLLDQERKI